MSSLICSRHEICFLYFQALFYIDRHQMNKIEQHLCKSKVDVDHIDEEIEKFMKERLESSASEVAEVSIVSW